MDVHEDHELELTDTENPDVCLNDEKMRPLHAKGIAGVRLKPKLDKRSPPVINGSYSMQYY